MVSESDIAEARRKAVRNGEEDPVAVAQRYLNVYRQMHIFPPEKKESFDQSLLNLTPLIISIISSLPGGLTFQDYIDEVLAKAGRDKSARDTYEGALDQASSQPQILSNVQLGMQQQPMVAPIVSGEAKISMDKDFASEFANIMKTVIEEQSAIQNNSLVKITQDIGKTQLFIAKKIDDSRAEHQSEISEICKIIAQSHTALSTSLATLGQNITNQNALVEVPSVERRVEDDMRLVEMITQSQERMMSGLLARLPQAVGVGNVNVTAPSRSIDDDIRLAEMIAKSQEKMLSELFERFHRTEQLSSTKEEETIKDSNENFKLADAIIQSQEKLISTLAEKLPQIIETKSVSQSDVVKTKENDDERLISLITKSQENMIKSLIEQNILSPRIYQHANTSPNPEFYARESKSYIPQQNVEFYNADNDYNGKIPIEDISDISTISEDMGYQTDNYINEASLANDSYYMPDQQGIEEIVSVVKKKKKKKKKKKTVNGENVTNEGLFADDASEKSSFDTEFDNVQSEDINIEQDVTVDYDFLSEIDDIVQKEENSDELLSAEETIAVDDFTNEINNTNYGFDNLAEEDPFSDNFEATYSKTDDELTDTSTYQENENIIDFDNISDVNESDSIWNDQPVEEEEVNQKSWDFNEDDNFEASEIDKSSWGIESEEDSWGFGVDEEDSEQNQNTDQEQDQEENWEYVEYEDDGQPLEEGWEYVEYEDDGQPLEEGWEYVEAIDDNANIFYSDSYSQQAAPVERISKNNRSKISLINVPQIYDEINDDETDDPYKK